MPTTFLVSGTHSVSTLAVIVFLVKATLILLAAFGITRLMHRSSAGTRHLVWLVALGALLLVPALTAWSPLRLAVLPAPAAAPATPRVATPVAIDADIAPPPASPQPAATPAAASTNITERAASFASTYSMAELLLALWALVALGIVASLAWAALAVRRIVRRARPLEAPAWRTPLFEIADRFELDEAPRLLCSDDIRMPFACGVLTPTIVLPADCETWTLERRRAVLLHELAHVRRHDLLGHTIGRLACAAYWFHPLVWSAAHALRSESERACDDLALACGTDAPDYAEHLLDIVTSVRGDATPLVALAMARRKEFEGRMLAILDPELRRAAPSRRQSLGLIATLALMAVTVGAAAPVPRAPQPTRSHARADVHVDHNSLALGPMQVRTDSQARTVTHTAMRQATQQAMQQATQEHIVARHDTVEGASDLATSIGETAGAAAGAVVKTTVPAVLDALLGRLTGARAQLQTQSPDERATLLAKVLSTDTSAALRKVAAWGLGEYADQPVAINALTNALRHDASASVREMSAWALTEGDGGRSDGAVQALTAALRSDASADVRATSAWALGNMGDRSAVDALVAALGDAEPRVRARALWAIGNVSPRQAPKQVTGLLKDSDTRVRRLAAWALYQMEDPDAVPALKAAVATEQDKDVQIAEIRALAALGEQSVDALRGLLESSDPRVKSMAVHALAGGQAAGPWPWPWPDPRPFP